MPRIFVLCGFLVTCFVSLDCEVYQDRPKIKTSNGDLILEPAFGKNIFLLPNGPLSSIYIGDIDMLNTKSKGEAIQVLPSQNHNEDVQIGDNRILQRLDMLERRIAYISEDNFFINITAIWRKINMLTRKIRILQTQVNNRGVDECQSNPCQHGGTCLNLINGYQCLCPSNWEGKDCDVDVNECRNFASTELGCQNGAACINKPGYYECQCKLGWFGLHCTKKTRDCSQGDFEMCGYGTCLSDSSRSGIICICKQGWTTNGTSDECLTDINECESIQGPRCSVNPKVECINLPGSFRCGQCPRGYQGDGYTCSDIDECTSIPNGGCSTLVACHNTIGSFTCGPCPPGYQGDGITCTWRGTCNIDHGGCHPSAQCIENLSIGQTAQCVCPVGMDGDGIGIHGCYISTGNQQSCINNPCGTHGQCHQLRSGYSCLCNPGYGGPDCSSLSNMCSNNPCLNGGFCRLDDSSTRGYRCECTAQYSGPQCEMHKTCGGVLDAEEGSIVYPLSNTTYNHNSRCAWVIHTVPSKVINVTFSKFSVEDNPDCMYDFLQIHDGRSSASQLLGRFCGNTFPNGGNIISSHNNLYFWFRSDATVAKFGFILHWTSIDPVCGGEIDATTHGQISSPGSPGPYPPNRDCYWHLKTDFSKKLQLHFFTLDIENHPNCSSDYLAIYDGMRNTDPLLNKYCNSTQPAPLESAGSEILVHFHSDAYGSGKGFQIAYSPISGLPGCGGYFTLEKGEISSPGYNGTYLNNMLCEYKIKTSPDTKIRLNFKQFNLEKSIRCRYDYLKIYDGPSAESPLVGRFCGNSHPTSYISSSNMLFLIFRSDITLSQEGFKIYYESVCELTFHGDSGVIKSPGYPFNYPEDRLCEYKISTVPGKAIQLTFQDFDIEDNNYYDCQYDNVEIRDGMDSNATLLGKYCGGSDHIPPMLLSTHNYMYIRFKSDMSLSGTGFYANYTTINTECGGIYRETTGLISHPSDGSNKYKNDQSCTWILVAPEGMHIQLTWNRFDLESMQSCESDYLNIIEIGDNNESNDIGKFCGTKAPPALTTLSNRLMLKFESDQSVKSFGFSVSYTFLDDNTHCNKVYFRTHGFIYSPGWPDRYEPNLDCTWILTVPVGQQIRLNISQFDLERPIANKCTYGDYLEIRNGNIQSAPMIGQYCGNFNTKILKSLSNSLYIRFHSDYYLTGKGFQLEWDGSITGCGGTLTTSSGSITSPNYPESYNENALCLYRIVTSLGSRIRLSFTDLELEHTTNCRDDYVKIFDGRDSGSPLLGSYCTMSAGLGNIETTSNYAYIKFRSDSYIGGKGFLLNYFTICNTNITGRHGVIESPDFPNNYPMNLNCLWNVEVLKGNKINVTFTSFDVFKSVEYNLYRPFRLPRIRLDLEAPCSKDYIQWKESSETTYSNRLCGNSLPPMITTKSNSLQIKFATGSHPRPGFRLEWVNVGCGGYIQKRSGTISIDGNSVSSEQLECEWIIETPLGTSVYFVISDLYLTESFNCTADGVEIYNGPNKDSQILSRICRNHERSTIKTSSNYALIRFLKNSSLKGAYINAAFITSKATCGGQLESTSGFIQSKNYPKNYDKNLDCIWTISVPTNHRIEINFLDIDLASSSCEDSIKIYDTKYFLASSNYTAIICPGSNISNFLSKNNRITLQFTSGNGFGAKGFKANFSMTCGASITAINDGIISNKDYSGKRCSWTIRAPQLDQKISLTITHISIPIIEYGRNGTSCWPSYLRIYDGDDEYAPLIDEYCGRKSPSIIVSRGSAITVLMGSYENNISGKFTAHYTSLNEACGGTLNSEEGSIASPDYPRAYSIGSNCDWTLSTSPGNKVYLTFEVFDLKYSDGCNEDYLEIREDNAAGKLLGVYCGTDIPLNSTSASKLYIKFHSNEESSGNRGFLIHYGFLHGNELINMDEGEIASPLYPHLYQGYSTYTWRIQSSGSEGIRISVDNLEISSFRDECDNTLSIYDGYDDTAPLLSEMCGVISNPVKILETSSNVAFIKLSLDFTNKGALFHLTWNKKQSITQNVDEDKINCGSNTTIFLDHGGVSVFESPNYPDDYNNDLNCEWIFQAAKGLHLKLSFDEFKLEESNNCFADYVDIYSSNTLGQWKPVKEHLCESLLQRRDINATTYMKVKFRTDSSITKKGFKGLVRSVCGGTLTDLSGEVEPYWQDIYSAYSASCQWSIKVRPGRVIKLKFTHFNITNSNGDCRTSVVLKNGETLEAPTLGSGIYCGLPHENKENLTTSSNALHISFHTEHYNIFRNAFHNFRIHYEEKNIECGGTSTLDFDQKWEIINSPNYPNPPDPFSECIWTFSAPPGETLRVDFIERFDLDYINDCGNEVVEIRDGSSNLAPTLLHECGDTPKTIRSTNNVIFIRYATQLSQPRNGFKANVSIGYCGGTLVAESGEITSPGYPHDFADISQNSYGCVCEWRVKGPHFKIFTIKPQEIDIPESQQHCETKITIEEYISVNKSDVVLKQFCNENGDDHAPIETLGNEFVVRLYLGKQSQWSRISEFKGFRFTFTSSKPTCGGEVATPEGFISTPGYPLETTLRYCQWTIKVPNKSKRIRLELIDVDATVHTIGMFNDRSFQSLIQNIPSDDYSPSTQVYESTGSTLSIFLWLNPTSSSHRFKAKFSSDDEALCGGDLHDLEGEISSPNIQRSYACEWHYNSNDISHSSILVAVQVNSSVAKSRCRFSDPKLSIRSWVNKVGYSFFRDICGTAEKTFRVPSSAMDIKGIRSKNNSFNFHLTWKSQPCGGIINVNENPVNILETPNILNKSADCAWMISMPYNNRLELKMEGTFLYNCDDEFLKIGQGAAQTSPNIGDYCKTKTLDSPLLLSFMHVYVEYHTLNKNSSSLKLMARTVKGQCGGQLTKYQNVFTSPNYPKNYEPSQECVWTITADLGSRVSLRFIDRFVIEDTSNCTKDAVILYDFKNDNFEEITKLCGRPNLMVYNSTFNKMKIILRTDSTTNLDGFKALWTPICGGNYLATENEQFLVSQGFPYAYLPMSNCTYTIMAPANKKLLIEFEELAVEGTYPDCLYDNITILGESDDNNYLYDTYCGSELPPVLSDYNTISIVFKSDKFIEMKGFKLKYQTYSCGGQINEPTLISSHQGENYGTNMNCTWFIEAPANKIIVLKFLYIDLESNYICYNDYVSVFDDFQINDEKRLALMCGHVSSTRVLRSHSNKVLLQFVSDQSFNFKGFKVEVLFTYSEAAGCGGDIELSSSSTKTFKSFRLGNNVVYENNIDCHWRIRSPPDTVIQIDFDSFHISSCANVTNQTAIGYNKCDCDFVEIQDGINPESFVIGTYCGHTIPPSLTSSGNVMSVRLSTDSDEVSSGFEARLSVRQSVCGKSRYALGDTITRLKSPGYERGMLTLGLHCVYHFDSESFYENIRLTIHDLDLRATEDVGDKKKCNIDKLTITRTPVPRNQSLGKDYVINHESDTFIANYYAEDVLPQSLEFCGSVQPSDIYLTGSISITLIISAEPDTSHHKGVDISVGLVGTCGSNYTGTQGKIQSIYSPKYYISDGDSTQDCYTLITAPENHTISAYFITITPDYWNDNIYLDIYDGNNTSTNKLASIKRDFDSNVPFFSTGMYMLLHSHGSLDDNVYYDMNYITTDKGRGCGGKLTNELGRVTSPMYPEIYRMVSSCEWELQTPVGTRLKLHFAEFDLGIICDQNYVELRDSQGVVISTYCSETPADYTSNDNYVKIVFHTTMNNGGRGWVADFVGLE